MPDRTDDEREAYTIVAPHTMDASADRPPVAPASRLVDRYRILRRIGKGGMGEVMVAHDEQIGRDVAIKRMRTTAPSERQIQRFLREASVQGRLEHPAIVPVHEIGRDEDGLPFFAMKRLAGNSLAKIIGVGDVPLQRVLRAFAEVCLAVEFAHVRGIVHRDLKPDNVILGDFGEVYVLDWGVAKVLGAAAADTADPDVDFADVDSSSGSGEHATAVGTAIGTPGYMAPEQVRGAADIDGRADIYTLGCMLFEILAGAPLHPAGKPGLASALAGIDARPSQRAPERAIAPELDAICVAATALDRDTRIATARELGDRVLEYLDGDRDLALRRNLASQHLARAKQAFEVDRVDGADQRVAIREAASALALDPTLDGAAELVGRLMLEPPREMPPEVIDALTADDVRTAKDTARAGIWAIFATLSFTPLLLWMAPHATGYVAVFTGFLLVNLAMCVQVNRAKLPRPGLVVITNTILVVFVARMFSPILIAPGVAAVLAMAMVLTPRFSILGSGVTVTVMLGTAILVPWALERVGVLATTMTVDQRGMLFDAPLFEGHQTRTMVVGALYAVGLIAGASIMAHAMRTRAREAARKLHLHAWQLRHLVP